MSWLICTLAFLGVIGLAIYLLINKRRRGAGLVLLFIGILGSATLSGILIVSIPHGSLGVAAPITMNPLRIIASTINSPVTNDSPGQEPGDIIILYRFGCEDCERTYDELKRLFPDASWVSSRSEVGKELVDKYSIKAVPTAIYFRYNHSGNEPEIIQVTLFEAGEDKKAVLNDSGVAMLQNAIEEKK